MHVWHPLVVPCLSVCVGEAFQLSCVCVCYGTVPVPKVKPAFSYMLLFIVAVL